MTTDGDRGSAKIFQFPPRGRFASTANREVTKSVSVAKVSFGAWYHEEAVADAERARQN